MHVTWRGDKLIQAQIYIIHLSINEVQRNYMSLWPGHSVLTAVRRMTDELQPHDKHCNSTSANSIRQTTGASSTIWKLVRI